MSVSVGDQAPGFSLKQKTEEGLDDVSLADFKGKQNVVLLFVPLAYTSVCTDELCSVSGGLSEYVGLNAKVLGISVDSPFSQEAWAKENSITVPLLSDFNKEVCDAYGCKFEDLLGFKGVAKRSAFVIDKEGVVRFVSVSDDPQVLPDFSAVKECLASLN